MFLRLEAEKPFMSGNGSLRSRAIRSLTRTFQSSFSCASRIILSVRQYIMMSWAFACSVALTKVTASFGCSVAILFAKQVGMGSRA